MHFLPLVLSGINKKDYHTICDDVESTDSGIVGMIRWMIQIDSNREHITENNENFLESMNRTRCQIPLNGSH